MHILWTLHVHDFMLSTNVLYIQGGVPIVTDTIVLYIVYQ